MMPFSSRPGTSHVGRSPGNRILRARTTRAHTTGYARNFRPIACRTASRPPRVSLRRRDTLGRRADVRDRQGEGEGRSLADRAGDGNLAPVRFHDRLDDVEAKPEACLALLASVLHVAHLVEAIEDLLQVLGRDPRPVVLHRDLQEARTPLG